MIVKFIENLNTKNIPYCVTNGYEHINNVKDDSSDYDFLFKKETFEQIDEIINDFCKTSGYTLVQKLHQEIYAKNFFLYDTKNNTFLNLDLYGEIGRKGIKILDEKTIFSRKTIFENIAILAPADEFIQYLIKKIDKQNLSENTFNHLTECYQKDKNTAENYLRKFFKNTGEDLISTFRAKDFLFIQNNIKNIKNDFVTSETKSTPNFWLNGKRILKRIVRPTGITIGFLGPDGSGKSTIIDGLIAQNLPFRRTDYFHLKPIVQSKEKINNVVENPHAFKPYGFLKSLVKLVFFIYQYNKGWFSNIIKLKIKSSLVIFDRYYDDLLVDNVRYRYGGGTGLAKLVRYFIPKPKVYFILTGDPEVIYKRKKEVPFTELQRQISQYEKLGDHKRYFTIDVNRLPSEIVKEVTAILMKKMNERY